MRLTLAMCRVLERVAELERGTKGLPKLRCGMHPIALRSCIAEGLIEDGKLSPAGMLALAGFRHGRRRGVRFEDAEARR